VPKSYLNAEPYGIGELISRKKHLRVPTHQRDYAWGPDEVGQLLDDLFTAVEAKTDEYFLGLVVIVGPTDGDWMVLDGQQRLATCTMVFAAVRFWLRQLSRNEDADQIQRQFISVRRLGGGDEPRLLMNYANRELFSYLIQPDLDTDELRERLRVQIPGSSNEKLISGFLACRAAVGEKMKALPATGQDAFLYQLSDFLENQSQVVCLEVDQAADAYKIFESLNDRGMALSALDLVKNFVFGTVSAERHPELATTWEDMVSQIVDADAEDFLKVAWTAQFGRVQRGALYSLIRQEYSSEPQVIELVRTLAVQAELYTAMLEPSHNAWADYGAECAGLVATLRDLRSGQVRPILLAALSRHISPEDMRDLLRHLVALTVRYQTIGRRRTGLIEIGCAKAAKELFGATMNIADSLRDLQVLVPPDEQFVVDFGRYRERNSKRAIHVLLGIESMLVHGRYRADWVHEVLGSEQVVVHPLLGKHTRRNWPAPEMDDPGFLEDVTNRLGNLCLLMRQDAKALKAADFGDASRIVASSDFKSTSSASRYLGDGQWGRNQIMERQNELAHIAADCWIWEPLQ
jgi:hypothetical protein